MSNTTLSTTKSSVTASDVPLEGSEEPKTKPDDAAAPPEPLPTASSDAVDFLYALDEHDYRYIMYEDNLVTISDAGKELGEFKVSVSQASHNNMPCLMVHANSHGSIDNVPCGTSITCFLSYSLETLEQQHHEYVKLENHPLDRKTFIVKQDNEYVINRVITQGDDGQRSASSYKLQEMEGFISEGSNLLLQRLLVKKGFSRNFEFISFDSNAKLCPALYRQLDKRTQVIKETEIDVTGIERTIASSSDLPTTWQSYFTEDGHLTNRVQVGSPVIMRLLHVPQLVQDALDAKAGIFNPDEDLEKPSFDQRDINIDDDMEMYSKYLHRKDELKNEHSVYMREHPELRAMLSDFTQFLLLRKPDDVVESAAEFFSGFSTSLPSYSAYMDSTAPTPFPGSRSNSKIHFLSRTNTGV